jgi:hypothetical protein
LPKVAPQDEEVAVHAEISEHAEEPSGDEEDVVKIDIRVDEYGRRWRLLGPDEVIQEGDYLNSIFNPVDRRWPRAVPPRGGWISASHRAGEKAQHPLEFIREVK